MLCRHNMMPPLPSPTLGYDSASPRRPLAVLLHAEHITIVRRLLRLPPRSLFPGALHDPATFTLRLCGVSAEVEGVELAQKELVQPLIGKYCDAELLFREQRLVASLSDGGGIGFSIAGSGQVRWNWCEITIPTLCGH